MSKNLMDIPLVDADGYVIGTGQIHILSVNTQFDLSDYGDSKETCYRVKLPMGWTPEVLMLAIKGEINYRCSCAHDCCGHWQHYVSHMVKAKRREYFVIVRSYVNV